MFLYLIQHGEAKAKEEDPERGLTGTGAANTRKCAAFFKEVLREQVPPSIEIRHSGKKRAQQTAQILADTIGCGIPIEACDGLAPNDDAAIIQELLETSEVDSIVLVGHMPHLPRLAARLLTGSSEKAVIHFRNAGIVCLSGENRNWMLEWMVTPGIV